MHEDFIEFYYSNDIIRSERQHSNVARFTGLYVIGQKDNSLYLRGKPAYNGFDNFEIKFTENSVTLSKGTYSLELMFNNDRTSLMYESYFSLYEGELRANHGLSRLWFHLMPTHNYDLNHKINIFNVNENLDFWQNRLHYHNYHNDFEKRLVDAIHMMAFLYEIYQKRKDYGFN